MTFTEAIADGYRKFFDFSGTANRPAFWWFALFGALLGIASGIVDLSLGFGDWLMGPANILGAVVYWIPSISVGTRRLHDIGKSGWWQLIVFVPLVGVILLIYWWCQPARQIAVSVTA